jgi:hypothetical protein
MIYDQASFRCLRLHLWPTPIYFCDLIRKDGYFCPIISQNIAGNIITGFQIRKSCQIYQLVINNTLPNT